MSTPTSRVLRNTVANWSAFGFAALVSFFLSPFIVHRLGDSAYGIWVLLGSLVGYLGLLDFGVRGAITRFVAALHARADHRAASATIAAALRLFAVLGAVVLVLSGLLALVVGAVFEIPAELVNEARLVVILGGLAIAASFIGGVFGGVVAGLHRFDLDGALEIVVTAMRAVAVVVALEAGRGLVTLSVIQLALSVFRGLVSYVMVRRLYPALDLGRAGALRPAVRQLLSFSFFASLIHISGVLIYQTDAMVIGAFLPVGFITYYAIAGSLTDYARHLVSAISRIVTPRASAEEASGGTTAVRTMFETIAPRASLLTIPIAATFVLRGREFIDLWMGPDYGPSAAPVLALLAVGTWFAGGRMICTATILGIDRHRPLAAAFASEAVANLVLSIALVGSLGLTGVAIGTIVPNTALALGFLPWHLGRQLGISPLRLVVRVWVLPSLACAGFAAATYAVARLTPAQSLLGFVLQTAALLPLVPLGAAPLVFTREERAAAWRLVARWPSRLLATGRRTAGVPVHGSKPAARP